MKNKKYSYGYPHPALATDCVVFGFDGYVIRILLIERGIEPYKGYWALPGGFMRMDETVEECALRELKEETKLSLTHLTQIGIFSDIDRDPRERVVSVAFYALAKKTEVEGGDDAAHAKWFGLNEIPKLAFDHDLIVKKALQKIKEDIHFEPIGFELLDIEFTIPELQRLYEAILDTLFDRRNFYKKLMQTGILKDSENEEDQPLYFGDNMEMSTRNIDELFSKIPAKNSASIKTMTNGKESRRRKGSKFSFDKEQYDKFKENHNFRLEF